MNGRMVWGIVAILVLAVSMPAEGAKPKAAKRAQPAESLDDRIAKALDAPIRLAFEKASLAEVADYLHEETKAPVTIDKGSLNRRASPKEVAITFESNDISLSSALDLMLHPLELEWCVWSNTLLITTREAADNYQTTKVYDIDDLVSGSDDATTVATIDQLINLITSTVDPVSWTDVGGRGSLKPLQSTRLNVLVIVQSWRAHQEIDALFAKLRSVAKPAKAVDGRIQGTDSATQPTGRTVKGLGPDDEVRIEYSSGGCFHFFAFDFTLSGKTPGTVAVAERVTKDGKVSLRPAGSVPLSHLDIQRLDNRIAFYRQKRPGRCTTVDSITISWLQDGKIVEKESFRDESCQDKSSMLNLYALANRVTNRLLQQSAESTEPKTEP